MRTVIVVLKLFETPSTGNVTVFTEVWLMLSTWHFAYKLLS